MVLAVAVYKDNPGLTRGYSGFVESRTPPDMWMYTYLASITRFHLLIIGVLQAYRSPDYLEASLPASESDFYPSRFPRFDL